VSIDTIYISTYRYDLPLTRICVASIRYWYDDVPIRLIKDTSAGEFNTREIEERWNVSVVDTGQQRFGWGFAKLEPLFFDRREKFLIVDSDTVFTGRVLDMLDSYNAPFIVDDETQPANEVKRLYYDIQGLKGIDPAFQPCGKNFNSGQWVGTSGLVRREDFGEVVEWTNPPRLKHPKMFMPGDQGVLNYVLEKRANAGRIQLERAPLMWWAPRDIAQLDIRAMARNSPYSRIIHWAGCKLHAKDPMPRADILSFFENHYYSRIPGGQMSRRIKSWLHYLEHWTRRVTRRLKK
jgi:hypothetical protein